VAFYHRERERRLTISSEEWYLRVGVHYSGRVERTMVLPSQGLTTRIRNRRGRDLVEKAGRRPQQQFLPFKIGRTCVTNPPCPETVPLLTGVTHYGDMQIKGRVCRRKLQDRGSEQMSRKENTALLKGDTSSSQNGL